MEMVLTPQKQKTTRRNSTPKLTTRSKLSKKCEFCQKIHAKFDLDNFFLLLIIIKVMTTKSMIKLSASWDIMV